MDFQTKKEPSINEDLLKVSHQIADQLICNFSLEQQNELISNVRSILIERRKCELKELAERLEYINKSIDYLV